MTPLTRYEKSYVETLRRNEAGGWFFAGVYAVALILLGVASSVEETPFLGWLWVIALGSASVGFAIGSRVKRLRYLKSRDL